MTISFEDETVETDDFKLFEDNNGTVILEDKTNGNQLELDDDVTMADVASHLVAGDNPHLTTLEQARAEDNQLSGSVDADGNDVTNVGALGAGEVQIGGGDAVTGGPVGDSGEWKPLVRHHAPYNYSTTSTTFVESTPTVGESPTFSTGLINLANISALGVSYYIIVSNDTQEESITVRIKNNNTDRAYLEYTFADPGDFNQLVQGVTELTEVDISNPPNILDLRFEHKVSGGTGTTKKPVATLWGQIS